nr:leucine zipper domain-containing protein [Pseudoclavibacter sp. VKM Ac-2867]
MRLARPIVEDGWTLAATARFFRVFWPTSNRWASRYIALGKAAMQQRSSRSHRSPTSDILSTREADNRVAVV